MLVDLVYFLALCSSSLSDDEELEDLPTKVCAHSAVHEYGATKTSSSTLFIPLASPEESQSRQVPGSRRQQDRQDTGIAEAAGRGQLQGADESDGMAAAFRARIPLRDRRQEAGADGYVHQGRGRGAHLLRRGLKTSYPADNTPPGWFPAAFLVLDDVKFG